VNLVRRLSIVPVALVVICAASLLGRAAQIPSRPTLRFNAGVDLVRLDVSVLDRHRAPVVGLTRGDFTVIEDGQPRPVQSFVEVHVPGPARADAPWTAQVPSDVASNTRVDEGGRLVVIVMDRSIPPGNPVMVARNVAASIVNALGPDDLAAVVSTSQPVAQNFTSDHALLLRALARPDWSIDISNEAHEIDQTLSAAGGLAPLSVMADGRCYCGRCVPDTIARVADSLAAADRRPKLLFFVGSNLLLQPPRLTMTRRAAPDDEVVDKLGCDVQLKDARTRMFDALTRAHVTVHSLDPSGLTPVGPAASAASTATGARVNPALASAIETLQQQLDNLRLLPDFTGGRTIVNTNTPQDHVPAIVGESASYYVLGFTPANDDPSRPTRSIDVKVNRPDVRVNAPKRYSLSDAGPRALRASETTAPRDAAGAAALPAALEDALAGLLPDARMPLALQVAAFAAPGSKGAHVTVSVDISALAPAPRTSAAAAADVPIEIVAGAYDQFGRPKASARQSLHVSWPAAALGARRVEALSRLDLPPGDYEIRVAAVAEGDRAASVFTHLTVLDYASAPLSLSPIVVGAPAGTQALPPGFLADVVPVTPTTARRFARRSSVDAFMQIYQGTTRQDALQPVDVRVRIVGARGEVARDQAVTLPTSAFGANRAANLRLALPVQNLRAGEDYLLSLEASMGPRQVGRAVRFRVE
jgi:VWFA-related protein